MNDPLILGFTIIIIFGVALVYFLLTINHYTTGIRAKYLLWKASWCAKRTERLEGKSVEYLIRASDLLRDESEKAERNRVNYIVRSSDILRNASEKEYERTITTNDTWVRVNEKHERRL